MLTGHLLRTLLELGHATSQNLEFAHRNGAISFGEETITEMNLLEIRRRHPDQVYITTFPKSVESAHTGADWEWHIVGRRFTLKMRVQAKRVNKRGGLHGIARQSPTSSMTQIDLLIRSAKRFGMKPIYCLYSSEEQRKIWTREEVIDGIFFESGCLLADAQAVKSRMPKRMCEIEAFTVPWHYLWSRRPFGISSEAYVVRFAENGEYRTTDIVRSGAPADAPSRQMPLLPTVGELNGKVGDGTDRTGLFETREVDQGMSSGARAIDSGISLLLVVDVRELDLMLRQFEPPTGDAG